MRKTSFNSDKEWLEAIASGSKEAAQMLYSTVFPMVKKVVVNQQGQEADAWDVFQESMIVLYRKGQSPDFQLTSKLSTFMVGIARLIWLKKKGKKHTTVLTDEVSEAYILEDTEMNNAERERLFREKLNLLGEQCRKILALFFKKTKMQEIAQEMNLASAEVARITKYRCTQKLMKMIQSDKLYIELKL